MSSMVQAVIGRALAGAEAPARSEAAPYGSVGYSETKDTGLVGELRGVPKDALKVVLGRELGDRVWRHARGKARWPEGAVADEEIADRLVRYLCQQAAVELRAAGKHAKFARLTVRCRNGRSASERARLPQLTRDADEIAAAVVSLLQGLCVPPALFESVDLDVTAATDALAEPIQPMPRLAATAQPAPA